MKVVGVGLGKTGTSTLGRCLETLGYKVKAADANLTGQVRQGKLDRVYEVARRYQAFQDHPWPLLYREMDERYEGSKFILTTRSSSEKWFESLSKHAYRSGPTEHRELIFGYEMPHGFKEEHIAFYEKHNRDVREYFEERGEDFLEVCWEKGDGWKEICEFLGHDVPEADFPHANRSPQPLRQFASRVRTTIKALVGKG